MLKLSEIKNSLIIGFKKSKFIFTALLFLIIGATFYLSNVWAGSVSVSLITTGYTTPRATVPSLSFQITAESGLTVPIYQYRLNLEDTTYSGWKDCTCADCDTLSDPVMVCGSGAPNIEGTLSMDVRVEDSEGGSFEGTFGSFLIDYTPPSVLIDDIVTVTGDTTDDNSVDFTGFVYENTDIGIISMTWAGNWPGSPTGICTQDGDPGTHPTVIPFICDPGIIPESAAGTSHIITITAENELYDTGTKNYTFSVDSTPPTGLSLAGPASTEFYAGYNYDHINSFTQRTMTISWDSGLDDDFSLGSDPVHVYFHSDGNTSSAPDYTIGTQLPSNPNSISWNIPDIDTTSGVIEIMAEDMAGNTISVYSNPITIHEYSPPTVTIDGISDTNSSSVNLTASVTGIDPGETIVSTQSSNGSCTVTVTGASTADLDCGSYSLSTQGNISLYVSIKDSIGDGDYDTESFTRDTGSPSVDAGTLGTINLATQPGASASDTYTGISSYSWSDVSGPGNIIFSNSNTLNPYISADTYSASTYTARLTVCDGVGNCASDTVDFIWTDQAISANFNIIEPSGGERLAGGDSFNIIWTSPGGAVLDNFDIEYSINGGSNWSSVISDLGHTTLTHNWSIPYVDSENVQIRVIAQDSSDSDLLIKTSSTFAIDSTAPSVNAGDLPNVGEDPAMMSDPTAPGATASDNFDSAAQLTYSWTSLSGPGGANANFSNSSNLDPNLSGTVTGSYTARLTVTDRVGNSASSDVTFNWDGFPPDFSIINPVGGETFAGNNIVPITWGLSSSAVSYNIYYSTDYWVSSNTIISSTNGTSIPAGLYYDWTVPEISSETVQVRVTGVDVYGNESNVNSNTFAIDSTPPEVDAGAFYNVVLGPTQPGATASDVGSGIETYAWTQDSGVGTLEFTGTGDSSLNPLMHSDLPGVYVARLTVCDYAGNCASDTVALITNTNPPTAVITAPGKDVHWKGGTNKNIQWSLNTDPGNLVDFEVAYSIDDGLNWVDISTTVPSSARLLNWDIPLENSADSIMRVITKNSDGETATATQDFVIDSIAPVITIGSLATSTEATTTGTIIVDNIDSQSEVSYLWSLVSAPAGGQIVFSPSNIVMDPVISGTVSGDYQIQVITQDQAGNLSNAFIGDNSYIHWDGNPGVPIVTNPTSTVITQGGIDYTIEWYMEDAGDLTTIDVEYTTDNITWQTITTGLASTSREHVWSIPEGMNSTSTVVRVTVYDVDSNSASGISGNFTVDSTAPVVDTGTMPTPISSASSSEGVIAIDNFDTEEFLDYQWSELSLPYPQAILTITDTSSTTTTFAGDMSGWYDVLLSVTDRAGNIGTSSLSFYWTSQYDPYITYPSLGVHLPGGLTSTATWVLENSGDLSHIEAHYSVNNGQDWVLASNNIASTSLELDWQVPDDTNSITSLFRIYTVDNLARHSTTTSQLFTIDSEAPYVDAGSFSDYLNDATQPGATTSDNLTSFDDLVIKWEKVSGSGDINFSDSTVVNPTMSATKNGTYVARLTVTDLAGNSSSDTVSFERKISSGPGGPSGPTYCSSVDYSDWSDCIDGYQTRDIIGYNPLYCTPTSAQLDAQERTCTGLTTCTSVTYGDWGECINGFQTRIVLDRYPEDCVLSQNQDSSLTQSCSYQEENPNDVMEDARDQFTTEDPALVKRLMGQILIQVEDLGRAWYVNVDDGARYYLGKPQNAFTVMSMMGKGIKNELLKKLPLGLLDPKLSNDNDSDGDGLTDRLEEGLETDFFNSDTDGDGFSDYEEALNGYDPLNPKTSKSLIDNNLLQANLGQIFIQVETNGEAWYLEPRSEKRYYLGRPLEAFNIMRQFGIGITNEDINKIPVGEFSEEQNKKIADMLEQRRLELETAK